MTMHYAEFPSLASYYLEDSFVLTITSDQQSLSFQLEVVLTEQHPDYTTPAAGEQYCYAHGVLTFHDITHVDWTRRNTQVYTDAAGDEDLGNIDVLQREDTTWRINGDWGEALITTPSTPVITLQPAHQA